MPRTTQETRFVLTAQNRTRAVLRSVRGDLTAVGRSVTGLHGKLFALAGIGGFGFLARGVINVNAEFQTLKASLKTVTGSAENAKTAFKLIEDFATTTPFDLQQVTTAFIKLKAFGLDPSEDALRSYGNTASAMGKSLDQMIEAVADAATGEFERLKEFGIRAKKNGEEVEFTFQGITKTVQFNSEAIQGYLRDIGTINFAGAMQDQMNNLTPAFSNLQASIDGLFVAIGEAGVNDAVASLARDMTAFIESLDEEEIKRFTQGALADIADFVEGINTVLSLPEMLGGFLAKNDLARIEQGGIGPAGASFTPGAFNASNPTSFDDWKRAIKEGTSEAELDPRVDKTNSILQEISERLRNNNVAVAG